VKSQELCQAVNKTFFPTARVVGKINKTRIVFLLPTYRFYKVGRSLHFMPTGINRQKAKGKTQKLFTKL
jgi:hypothetical protein